MAVERWRIRHDVKIRGSRVERHLLSVFYKADDIPFGAHPLALQHLAPLQQHGLPAGSYIDVQPAHIVQHLLVGTQHDDVRRGQLLVVVQVDMRLAVNEALIELGCGIIFIGNFIVLEQKVTSTPAASSPSGTLSSAGS